WMIRSTAESPGVARHCLPARLGGMAGCAGGSAHPTRPAKSGDRRIGKPNRYDSLASHHAIVTVFDLPQERALNVANLECQLQRQLQLPWLGTEGGRRHHTKGARLDVVSGCIEHRRICQVERLGAELQLHFFGDAEVFEKRKIQVLDAVAHDVWNRA